MRAILEGAWLPRAVRALAGATACALVAAVIPLMPGANASSTVDRILFGNDGDGDLEIFSANPDGSDLRQLTSNAAWDTDPAWSPDGTKVAFSSNRDGDDDIWVMNADASGTPVNLTDPGAGRDVQPDWSRDGTKVVFVRDGAIYRVAAGGGTPVKLAAGKAPAWSPVGARIAFVRGGDIYLMNGDGSGVAVLTDDGETDSPGWSPDGTEIAFESTNTIEGESRIKRIDVATGAVVELPGQGDDFHPSWSPDGNSLVFTNITLEAQLVVSDADGLQRRSLLTQLDGYEVLPSWSGCVGVGCDNPAATPSDGATPTESTSPTESNSPTVGPTVSPTEDPGAKDATTMSLEYLKRRYRVKVAGSVRPKHPNMHVRVTLSKRKNGRWVRIARKLPQMDSYGHFATRLKRPARPKRCRLKAVFDGDADHLRSAKVARFRC